MWPASRSLPINEVNQFSKTVNWNFIKNINIDILLNIVSIQDLDVRVSLPIPFCELPCHLGKDIGLFCDSKMSFSFRLQRKDSSLCFYLSFRWWKMEYIHAFPMENWVIIKVEDSTGFSTLLVLSNLTQIFVPHPFINISSKKRLIRKWFCIFFKSLSILCEITYNLERYWLSIVFFSQKGTRLHSTCFCKCKSFHIILAKFCCICFTLSDTLPVY